MRANPVRTGPRSRFRPLLASLLVATVLVTVAGGCTPRLSLSTLDHKLYATSLPAFLDWWRSEQAAAQGVTPATVDRWLRVDPARLDAPAARRRSWDLSTDLCSMSPDVGAVFDFRGPCIRHDLAWRNLRRLDGQAGGGIATRARRLDASRQFLRDMQLTCSWRPVLHRPGCRALAQAYFTAVAAVS